MVVKCVTLLLEKLNIGGKLLIKFLFS